MPQQANCKPCLTLSNPMDRTKLLQIDIPMSSPFDWEQRLHSNPAITKICIVKNGATRCCTEDIELKLALQLRKYRGRIDTIEFTNCRVKELVHLSFATTNYDGDPSLAFGFTKCIIERRAGRALKLLLEDQCIGELAFEDCHFEASVAQLIQEGLSMNRSVRQFHCKSPLGVSLVRGQLLPDMLNSSDKLVKLSFSAPDHDVNFWRLFQSAHDNTSLQYLQLYRTDIDVTASEAVLINCFVMQSVRELCFSRCDFQQPALNLLLKTLSHHNNLIDTLTFYEVTCFESDDVQLQQSCGSVLVRKLVLDAPIFGPQTWTRTINDMANNPNIQCLHIRGSEEWEDNIDELCEVLIRQNRGPSELILEDIEIGSTILPQVLQQGNTNVTSLTIDLASTVEIDSFVRDLANMRGLRKLCFKFLYFDDEDFQDDLNSFQDELVRSLESNSSLHTLSMQSCVEKYFSEQYLTQMRYWLAINRVGRHRFLTDPTLPIGMWPHILANSANEPAGIYFVLRNKPEIML